VNITRETWARLQRTETLLVFAAAQQFPEKRRALWDGIDLEESDRMYLTRFVSGFDPGGLRAVDYQVRYPFSTERTIEKAMERLVDQGILDRGKDRFSFTPEGMNVARTWLERAGDLLDGVAASAASEADTEALLELDKKILEGLYKPPQAYPTPILSSRAHGLQPDYSERRLWHHWQLVWSMIASHEDAQESVRKERGIAPLEWFILRQLWFVSRQPWRARLQGSSLHAIADRYAPIEEAACRETWAQLLDQGLVEGTYESPKISEQGMNLHDADEEEVDRRFLSCWPRLSDKEIDMLTRIVEELNGYLERKLRVEEST